MAITIVSAKNAGSELLLGQLEQAMTGMDYTVTEDLHSARGKLLFAVALDACGCNDGYYQMLRQLRGNSELLLGCTAALIAVGWLISNCL